MPVNKRARQNKQSGQWLVMAAAVFWGTTGTAQAFAPDGAQPSSVGAVRLIVGGFTLLLFAALRGAFRGQKQWLSRATITAAVCIALYQLCFFAGVARTGVAAGTIVAIGSAPIFAGLIGLPVHGERPGWRWGIATTLAVLGCAFLIADSGELRVNLSGILLALGAGLAYATYAVASKRLLEKQPPEAAMAIVFSLGAVLLLPVLVTSDLTWIAKPRGLGVALHLGLVTTAIAYILFSRGLKLIPVATAVTLSLAEPLTAALLGLVVLGEQHTPLALGGIGLILSGLFTLSVNQVIFHKPSGMPN
ncbi:MAG TPA: EamA family transporter [Anaerolineales bacterium]|nr:EamA family transporter [Anaerolineales bacterium]